MWKWYDKLKEPHRFFAAFAMILPVIIGLGSGTIEGITIGAFYGIIITILRRMG